MIQSKTSVLLFQIILFLTLKNGFSLECASQTTSGKINIAYTSEVFSEGENNYRYFRIPALLSTDHGLMAFCEGRKNSLSDNGRIDIVLKKSNDMGRTWGNMVWVVGSEDQSCQNPAPVYIRREKKIILLYTKRTMATETEEMIRSGNAEGYIGAFKTESYDQGLTWSESEEITGQVKRKNWLWYAFGPGGAIRLSENYVHPGRIIIPANHSIEGGTGNDFLGAHVVYSDDDGISWHIGAVDDEGLGTVNPNELAVEETGEGLLYFNARNQNNAADPVSNRAVTFSMDGGDSFTGKFQHEPQLITPVVHCSLERIDDRLIFTGPNHRSERKNLSLWISENGGLTWDQPVLLINGPSAYSSMCDCGSGNTGILCETGEKISYERIIFILAALKQ